MEAVPQMGEMDRVIGEHAARIKGLENRAVEDRAYFDSQLRDIHKTLNSQMHSLDEIQKKQDEAAGAREEQMRMLRLWLSVISVLIPSTGVLIEILRWKIF